MTEVINFRKQNDIRSVKHVAQIETKKKNACFCMLLLIQINVYDKFYQNE